MTHYSLSHSAVLNCTVLLYSIVLSYPTGDQEKLQHLQQELDSTGRQLSTSVSQCSQLEGKVSEQEGCDDDDNAAAAADGDDDDDVMLLSLLA